MQELFKRESIILHRVQHRNAADGLEYRFFFLILSSECRCLLPQPCLEIPIVGGVIAVKFKNKNQRKRNWLMYYYLKNFDVKKSHSTQIIC